ncbi:TPA: hypothetical protein ACGFEM_003171 [Clostridioides difficile]|uniref:hypothetical protein n=1 Tax=Clostridioides difficile TaxID=1496 RepID=UPI00038D8109|nr:hypothetical protein [Clostridioides difficile]AXU53367.1 hypothetical protein CDIF29637_01605 [Clostridioides difficile]EGT3738518.1 hypothetical protein [Clostridioides difficile]EGT3791836.1 hypothetical protein [Clostridioides difficile]EGT4736253.1 hypothetical protein [Clostridioides difficile]EGT4844765.1 hypothetical protein [Clostridioides difficile]
MPDFIVNRNIKKRRGKYSSRNLFEARAFAYEDGTTFTGIFNVSDEKIYSVSSSTTFSLTSNVVYMPLPDEPEHQTGFSMEQKVRVEFINDPIINIDSFENLSKGCTINYSVIDQESTIKFTITEKLNNTVLTTRNNTVGGNYEIILTNEQILGLDINSQNSLIIEISTNDGGLVTSKTVTFTRTNNKPVVTINSYNSKSAKFIVSDLENNLSKIEWYLDDVLKETITTDLTAEKTINYELTDNAIHTLKIVATDAENATVEKVLSISKEIMPLQSDATLQDISTKLVEIGEGFRNGKTSIINTLALKNIEASLNNTLVELSEKIKTSFDSSDASVQDLMNQLTQANNTISQLNSKYKYASGTIDVVKNSSLMANLYGESFGRQPGTWLKIDNLGFIPNIFVAECQYVTSNNYFFKHIVIATCNINWLWEKKDFSARIVFTKEKNSNQDFSGSGIIYSNNERDVYINNKGINVPASSPNVSSYLHSWHAIKFK